MDERISVDDVLQYQHLITKAPSFLLGRMAKKKSNLVSKFKSPVQSYLARLNDDQRNKLHIVLNSEVEDLQALMAEAYKKTKIKQYKILSDPKHKEFIEFNLDELRKII
ncbi:hypothetical protein [uncultured Methanobrevibacter sp.]|jgi:hypothetical protein|uniref:hypothetical protein n=1 Tax=uncultured Methanobrevibacter sp. TaxID=253161 RepID=UPI0025EB8E4D|nr:hypothetical protein [uncultured Methanobrevibacter sp.]